MLILPLVGREIPLIADEYVERDFGTGVVKITPAHDPNDFEVGLRHDLPVINVMTDDGHMTDDCGKYAGMDIYECRKQIVKDLEEGGYLIKIEPMKHNVGSCYRCHTVVEPRVSKQWFVKMEPLAKPAVEVVRNKEIKLIPERMEKIYYNWMENIKDWCISRQLWWGHRIPAWYCADCGETIVAKEAPSTCPKCGGTHLHQDEDTLDTWFSSALWPFSTLGWPDETPELKHYYPTSTLVTGYDIIFFWVARMIFSALEYTGKAPFNTVLFHGLVRDAQGRKMSKSLGNGIDPLEIIAKYGADALRFALSTGNSPGNDMRFSDEKVESSRNFANKIWNAARFVLMNLPEDEPAPQLPETLETEDKWVLSKYNTLVKSVTDNLDKFELGVAVQKLYDFIWDILCDWYIELVKVRLREEGETAANARAVLVYVMSNTLKLLHPFMPFITEEIWQTLPHVGESIMISAWPEYDPALDFSADEAEMERVMDAIRAIRNRRAQMNVPPSKKAKVIVETAYQDTFANGAKYIERLASASEVEVAAQAAAPDGAVSIVTADAKIFIPLDQLVDLKAELARLNKERDAAVKMAEGIRAKLANENFVSRAPEHVVQTQRDNLARLNDQIAKLDESIAAIQ